MAEDPPADPGDPPAVPADPGDSPAVPADPDDQPADPGDGSIDTPWSQARINLVLAHVQTRNPEKLEKNRNTAETVKLQDLMDEFGEADGSGKPERKADLKGILDYLRDNSRRLVWIRTGGPDVLSFMFFCIAEAHIRFSC